MDQLLIDTKIILRDINTAELVINGKSHDVVPKDSKSLLFWEQGIRVKGMDEVIARLDPSLKSNNLVPDLLVNIVYESIKLGDMYGNSFEPEGSTAIPQYIYMTGDGNNSNYYDMAQKFRSRSVKPYSPDEMLYIYSGGNEGIKEYEKKFGVPFGEPWVFTPRKIKKYGGCFHRILFAAFECDGNVEDLDVWTTDPYEIALESARDVADVLRCAITKNKPSINRSSYEGSDNIYEHARIIARYSIDHDLTECVHKLLEISFGDHIVALMPIVFAIRSSVEGIDWTGRPEIRALYEASRK